jgi:hypothetical protein
MKPTTYLIISLVAALGCGELAAAGNWNLKTAVQALAGSYRSSGTRDQLSNAGLFLHGDYLEQGGVSLGYNRTMVGFLDENADIDQDQFYLSGRYSLTPDWAAGRVSFRLDGHWIENDDQINGTGDLEIIAPQASYINLERNFYVDLGYARSSYGEAGSVPGDLTLDQLTPTLAFGLNEARDWLQFRGYLIDASNPARVQDKDTTAAVEAKWTHWFGGSGPIGLENVTLSALVGERLFGVDPDSAVVYNIADLQTDSVGVAGQWRLNDTNRLLLQIGYEGFEGEPNAGDYNNIYLYLTFTHQWD